MHQILRDIRSVAGVTGVAIIVKQDGHVERLFPAAFTEEHTTQLLKLVTTAYQRLRGFSRLSLRFERVVVHLFNQPDYLLFATVLPDTEEGLFETMVKSKLPAVSRALVCTVPQSNSGPRRATASRAPAPGRDPVDVLLKSFSGVSQAVGRELGLAKVAACWRQARDSVVTGNPAFTAIEIDAAGRLSLRKGRVLSPSPDNMESIAAMLKHFFQSLGTVAPTAEETFYSLTKPYRDLLEHCGFVHFLRVAFDAGARLGARS